MLASSFIFASVYGTGAVIAIGVIVLPILLSVGLPPKVAAAALVFPFGAAMYINVALFNIIKSFFPKDAMASVTYGSPYIAFAFVAFGVTMVIGILMLIFNLRGTKLSRAWAVNVQPQPDVSLPWYAFLAPIIPLVTVMVFKWPILPAFMAGIVYAMLTTLRANKKPIQLMHKAFYDGMSDVAGVLLIALAVWIFMGGAAAVTPILRDVLGPILPSTKWTLVLFFTLLAPLVLYRGPLNITASGVAFFAVLLSANLFTPAFIFAACTSFYILIFSVDPTSTMVLWPIGFVKVKASEYLKMVLPWGWVAVLAGTVLAVFMVP